MNPAKTVSVVIPTLGRQNELIATIDALLRQTAVPDEIIVVDQNEPSFAAVDNHLMTLKRVRHIRSRRKGVCHNENIALREAKGDIVLFVDDDVVLERDLIEKHLANYARSDAQTDGLRLGGIAGRFEQPHGDRDPGQIRRVGKFNRWMGSVVANFNSNSRVDVDFAQGVNMSFLRSALVEAGGVDEGFDGNGYFWETDLGLRVRRSGYRIVFDPQARLRHLMAKSGGCRLPDKSIHTYYYVKNGMRLMRRHSPKAALLIFIPRTFCYLLAKAAYNMNPKIFTKGLGALWTGATQSLKLNAE